VGKAIGKNEKRAQSRKDVGKDGRGWRRRRRREGGRGFGGSKEKKEDS
jgi:hypothetical protein